MFGSLLMNAQTTKKVLFLGNSYTQYNNLPSLVAQSATSTNDVLIHDSNLIGGYSLEQHATNQTSLSKINGNQWDYVVLQDQSQKPAFPINYVNTFVFPYAIQFCQFGFLVDVYYRPICQGVFLGIVTIIDKAYYLIVRRMLQTCNQGYRFVTCSVNKQV